MTYKQLCARLSAAGIESAAWDASLLLAHFCGVDPALPPDPARDFDAAALAEAVEQRAAHTPLQYILGEWSFFRQTYEVNPDCLIPRSDTEVLVEKATHLLPRGAYFADLCTGSGCIAVSTLCERPDTRALAVDKFPQTLALATRNAARNGVAERFSPLLCDLLAPDPLPDGARFDAILSNPTYIRSAVLEELAPELSAEPAAALDGGGDGLVFYRALVRLCRRHLKTGGFALFEIGYDQADAVRAIAADVGYACRIIKDLSSNDRVAVLTEKN